MFEPRALKYQKDKLMSLQEKEETSSSGEQPIPNSIIRSGCLMKAWDFVLSETRS